MIYGPGLIRIKRALSFRPLVMVGRWSYSLYLWHVLVLVVFLWAVPGFGPVNVLRNHRLMPALPVLTALSLGLACLSYYGIERPLIEMRKRFGSRLVDEPPATRSVHAGSVGRAAEFLQKHPVSADALD